jgi:hypothetical protein
MQYGVRHAVAATVVIGCIAAFTAFSYFALLLWCVVARAPIGGPLAAPGMLMLAIVAAAVSIIGVLWPVTTLTEFLCDRLLRWHRLAQIPVATILMFAYLICASLLFGKVRGMPAAAALTFGTTAASILLVPLGAYWWSLQAAGWMLGLAGKMWRWLWRLSEGSVTGKNQTNANETTDRSGLPR